MAERSRGVGCGSVCISGIGRHLRIQRSGCLVELHLDLGEGFYALKSKRKGGLELSPVFIRGPFSDSEITFLADAHVGQIFDAAVCCGRSRRAFRNITEATKQEAS